MHDSMKRLQEVAKTDKNTVISRDLNVGASTVANWVKRGVSKEGALAAAAKYQSDANYILDGIEEEKRTDPQKELEKILDAGAVLVDDGDDDMVSIPIYDLYFCCGDGNGSCEFENIKGYRKLPPTFFKDRNIRPDDFKLICAINDSNHPYIKDGDEVGIVITDREIKDGEYYAILLDGDRMIKQIFREAGGSYRLTSFNKAYPDKVVTPEHSQSLIIAGRQVYRAG